MVKQQGLRKRPKITCFKQKTPNSKNKTPKNTCNIKINKLKIPNNKKKNKQNYFTKMTGQTYENM